MLIVRPISAGAGSYYRQGPPGRWLGTGAALLDLQGIPSPESLARVLAGSNPADGARLGHAHAHRRAGWDLIFAAPKSVSLLAAMTDERDGRAVCSAHRRAVVGTMDWLAAEASWSRRDGQLVAADGIVAAAFEHGNSASGDPHLHTHVLMANLVHGADNRWTAMDASTLWRQQRTIGALYDLALRYEMGAMGVGVPWTLGPTGLADISGMPREVIDAVSLRSQQLRADLGVDSDAGIEGPTRRRVRFAAARTRQVGADPDWRQRFAATGFGVQKVHDLLGPSPVAPPPVESLGSRDVDDAHVWLAEQSSTWSKSDGVRSLAATLHAGAPPHRAMQLVDDLCRQSSPVDPDRWTSATARALDQAVLRAARSRRVPSTAVADRTASELLADRPHLSAQGQAAVRRLVTSGEGIEVLGAKVGRNRFVEQAAVLDAARAVWQAAGARVALDAGPAEKPRWAALTGLAPVGAGPPPSVVIVDRADRRTSGELLPLLEQAIADRTKVVLVMGGTLSPRRHAISAAVASLAREVPVIDEATLGFTAGRPPMAVRSGPALACSSTGDVFEAVLGHWGAVPSEQRALLVGLGRPEVDMLNRLARDRLRSEGVLGPDQVSVGGRAFALGDRVLAYRHGPVPLGTPGTVTAIGNGQATLAVRWDIGEGSSTPVSAWDGQRLAYGYAATPRVAAGIPGPTLLLGDLRHLAPLRNREALAVVVAPVSQRPPPPLDRLSRLAGVSPGPPPPEVGPGLASPPFVRPPPPPPILDVRRPSGGGESLAELAARREELGAELRTTLPGNIVDTSRRLAEDRAYFDQQRGGASYAQRFALEQRAARLGDGETALRNWVETHAGQLAEWSRLDQVMNQRADLVACAAKLDPASAARQAVGPPPPGATERALWERVVGAVSVHADRWPDPQASLDSPAKGVEQRNPWQSAEPSLAALVSRRNVERALQDLERALDRTSGRRRDLDLGLGL